MAPESKRTVPELLVEKLALGELPADQAAEVRRRLEVEPGGLDRLEALRRSNEEILLEHPPREVVPEIRRRAKLSRSPKPRTLLFVLAPLATAAAVALVFQPAQDPGAVHRAELGVETADEIRTKGDTPVLRIYRRAGSSSERLEPGATVAARDLLQVAYVAMGNGYGVVFSIDGRGGLTLHHPRRPGESQALLKAGEVLLPRAYELDDAPGFERFFIVGSQDGPVDLDAVLAGARRLARDPERARGEFLELPEGLKQYSITLRKEE